MNLANAATNFLVGKLGVNVMGTMVLTVRGRKSGEPRSVVVNPLELNGNTYLMSPRGETQWVKNVRVNPELTLHRGSRRSGYWADEVTDAEEKLAVMRSYLDHWSWQVKGLMGVSDKSSDDELRAIIDSHPIFVLHRN